MKGIIIKEIPYKDNDKILTILTDKLGKISCIARGAKRTNSPILANSQYLVYSEFVLYKSKKFYYINSASVINMFYKFRVDFDKMEKAFELTRIINLITDENEDTSDILKLFLNTIYIIENDMKDIQFVLSVFRIKLFSLLGFAPNISKCSECGQPLKISQETDKQVYYYYDYVSNIFVCDNCIGNRDLKRYLKISYATVAAIRYISKVDLKKVFSFKINDCMDLKNFSYVFTDTMINGI